MYVILFSLTCLGAILFGLKIINVEHFTVGLTLIGAFGVFTPLLFDEIFNIGGSEKTKSEVVKIGARADDKGLQNEIDGKLSELNEKGKAIDSIQIVEATGYNDHRKEVFIIYH